MKERIVSECEHHILSESGGKIEFWMTKRLSNEPMHSWMKKALQPLQGALKTIEAKAGQLIEATYVSNESVGRSFDVENVLFYNVRAGNFEKSSRHGLRFRYLKEPVQPSERAEHFPHYQSYRLVEKDTPFLLGQCEKVASYEFRFPSSHKLELNDVWWGSMNVKWEVSDEWKCKLKKEEVLAKFALRVDTQYPKHSNEQYAVSHMKEIFDGIVSAMHRWQNPDDEIVREVGSRLKISYRTLFEKFRNNDHALLGKRELLFKRILKSGRFSINWNPADDMERLIAGELLLCPGEGDEWRFKVEILSVE